MTQVTNLNTAMGAPARTNHASSKQEKSQELLAEFAGIMNQNAQNFMNPAADYKDRVTEMTDDVFSVSHTGENAKKDYEKLGSTGKRDIAQAKKPTATDSEYTSREVKQLADDVKEVVKETMQVSDEDIEQAMEALGLNVLDLLQPQNLIELVQSLTGNEDVSALLTNADFQITMQEVTGLITDFQQENGLNAQQFTDLLSQLSEQIDEMEEIVKELLNVGEAEQSAAVTDVQTDGSMQETGDGQEIDQQLGQQIVQQTEQNVPVEDAQVTQKTAVTAEQETLSVPTTQEETKDTSVQADEQPVVFAEENLREAAQTTDQGENPTAQDGKSKQQTFANTATQEPEAAENHTAMFHESTVMTNEQIPTAAPEVPQVESYIELQHLMDQMEGLARSFASAAGTTLEMQLNPENLGRLVLSVTERHGNVTAQITATNEQVKEALQTQMVELRSTLQEQGIKVEAVEVTVATHEFEQNLDGNASANGQMQEQDGQHAAGQQNGRRNLNMNSLDELSGLMSEEETLVAQMMRDNGGTVDYTA